ncbi:MAG TPA: TadE/TadG family type IV pilus assembly protein [Allosphingosinicella sp.]|jgi:Flp pilus assembly protein TadG
MAKTARRSFTASPKRSLAGDERGATLIEFGLFFPILALLLLGTIDLGRGLATKFQIEQATQRTIELANLGGRPQADYSYLVPEAVSASGVPANQVTLSQWLECRTASGTTRRETSFSGACQAGEQTARYVTITIWKDYVPMFASIPLLGRVGSGANGSIRLTADSGVRIQ